MCFSELLAKLSMLILNVCWKPLLRCLRSSRVCAWNTCTYSVHPKCVLKTLAKLPELIPHLYWTHFLSCLVTLPQLQPVLQIHWFPIWSRLSKENVWIAINALGVYATQSTGMKALVHPCLELVALPIVCARGICKYFGNFGSKVKNLT